MVHKYAMFLKTETIKHSKQKHVNLGTPQFSFMQERSVAADEIKCELHCAKWPSIMHITQGRQTRGSAASLHQMLTQWLITLPCNRKELPVTKIKKQTTDDYRCHLLQVLLHLCDNCVPEWSHSAWNHINIRKHCTEGFFIPSKSDSSIRLELVVWLGQISPSPLKFLLCLLHNTVFPNIILQHPATLCIWLSVLTPCRLCVTLSIY